MHALAALAAAVACAGCPPSLRDISHRTWHAVDTSRVHVESDTPVDAAVHRALLIDRELQQLFGLYHELGATPPAGHKVTVVVLADCDEMFALHRTFNKTSDWGRSADLDDVPTVELCDDGSKFEGERVRYALARLFNDITLGHLPFWLDAGLAEYLAAARRSGDVIQLGRQIWREGDARDFDAAIASQPDYGAAFAGWKVVQAMEATPELRTHAAALFAALASGTPLAEAWAATMKDVEPAVRAAYTDWSPDHTHTWKLLSSDERGASPAVSDVAPIAAAARLVDLATPNTRTGYIDDRTASAWNALHRADPTGDTAAYWRALVAYRTGSAHAGDAHTLFAQYLRRRPDDPRAHLGWLMVEVDQLAVMPDGDARRARLAALEPSVAKATEVARGAAALAAIGRYWLLAGKLDNAQPFVDRATAFDRGCESCAAAATELAR